MNAIAFDTHAHVKRLVNAGMSEGQAEAVIEAVKDTTTLPDISQLATKGELTMAVTAAVAELRSEILSVRADMKGLRGELIWWIIGTSVVSTVAHLFIK